MDLSVATVIPKNNMLLVELVNPSKKVESKSGIVYTSDSKFGNYIELYQIVRLGESVKSGKKKIPLNELFTVGELVACFSRSFTNSFIEEGKTFGLIRAEDVEMKIELDELQED